MLTIRIIKADGRSAPRKEIVSLYASDMDYVPFRRNQTVDGDGTIHLPNPEEPVILHAKLLVPGFGFLWVTTDNCGQGYIGDQEIDFIYDVCVSRIYDIEKVIEGGEFKPSVKCRSMLNDAKTLLQLGEAYPSKAPAYYMSALAAGLWGGELAAVERAQVRIEKQGKRNVLFGAGGFHYPYDGWRGNLRGGKQIQYPGMPGMKENYDSIFNYATLPFYLAEREPEYGKPNFAYLDHLQDAFTEAGIITKGHPLWWAHPAGMPEWTKGLRYEDGSLQREIKRTITTTVDHFRGRTQFYDAINENHDWCNTYNLTHEQQPIITKYCVDCIHDVDPDAKAVVNTCFMFGENAAEGRTYAGPTWERNLVAYSSLQLLEELDVEYEAIGMQLYNPARDMLALDHLFERFARFGRKLHLTELGVPSMPAEPSPSASDGDIYCLEYMYYGLWHELEWNERLQADWIEQFYTIAYSHPEVEAITMWSMEDPAYIPGSGLFTKDFEPKESFFRIKELERSWGFDFGKKD